jgi:hypothetical protein
MIFSPLNWLIGGLCAALLAVGGLYQCTRLELAETRADLATAEKVNEANRTAMERLERSLENTDKILAGWNEDRTTLDSVRSATRAAIKEAMRDETLKAWLVAPAPADAWRLLNAPFDADGNGISGSSGGAAGGLPGDAGTSVGEQWRLAGGGADAAP